MPIFCRPYGEIYVATNRLSGKCYVGQTTVGVEERWKKHVRQAGKGKCFSQALKKYGSESFDLRVVDSARTREELDQKESLWIRNLRSMAPEGYNLRPGGLQSQHTPESRMKISVALKGRSHSPDHVEKRRQSKLGKKHSPAAIDRMKASHKNRKPVSPEARAKMSQSRTGKVLSSETKAKLSKIQKARYADDPKMLADLL